ncbi:uncharacterized protein LOC111306018 [Durio zibethinus]|uniref:Uncharacterized protein LOC111306018 n=1 Tax=Durio zibethinus TaxID=66656 RepID=A0A6P6A4J7_DURZI|nr:uncharacterized protein LOC111306018 [Durio zibethinus]
MESAGPASKKREISHDDDDEEENMEKFYALVKSIREARDHLIMNNSSAEIANNEAAGRQSITKKRKLEEEKQVVVWQPSFQREDFMEEADQLKKPPAVSFASTSQSKEGTDINDPKEKVKEGLDLTLSL